MNNFLDEEVERTDTEETTEPVEQGGLFTRLRLPLIIVLIIVLAGGTVWWFFFRTVPEELTSVASSETLTLPPMGEIYMIDDLILNLEGGRRIFMVAIGLEYFDEKTAEEIAKREPLLRDNLITFFSSQPREVLTNIKYRELLRGRVKKIMDHQLGENTITRVIFVKWMFQ
ncbi:flagellar basal body-associated FliL family protein [bacterium]|nr:flagellar basal body-associated FliL family protein [bacterium]